MASHKTGGDFLIRGNGGIRKLQGKIAVSGAKNAAIKVMAASFLFEDEVRLRNIPEIEDLFHIAKILESVGVSADFPEKHTVLLKSQKNIGNEISNELGSKTRSSIVLTAPILARTGKVVFGNPGGCNLGERPIDLWLDGYRKMGANVKEENGLFKVEAKNGKLRGAEIFFKVQSHTATEGMMLAACLAEGKTVLKNCALEPEVKSLADFLNSCGAKIDGAGTHTITVQGTGLLSAKGKEYITIPDRIEAGSFLILGALAAKELVIEKCEPKHFEIVTEILRSVGSEVEIAADTATVRGGKPFKALPVRTHEYPGLATDLQAPMAVLLSQMEGKSSLFETIYEGRLNYLPELQKMGVGAKLKDSHRAIINGPSKLTGCETTALDIRSGMALIIAAAIAEGETFIHNAYMVDRGYDRIEERLRGIGMGIERIV
ncbi:MAG: UDP-N-acetylglucosamine 1-carboxyvinyltransferase [bacterium]|nr:UDP-N-acetylglucosamine 1-carboxyvinyltransferase [bacterium]